jgi:ATP-binding cassette, subfamily B, bacterial PglK
MLQIIRKFITFLDPASRIQMALLLFPMLLTAMLELASIGLIVPVIHAMVSQPGESGGFMVELFQALLPNVPPHDLLPWIAGLFAAAFIVKNIILFAMTYIIVRFIRYKTARFMQRMFRIYLRQPFSFHLQRNSAEILRNLTTGAGSAFEGLRVMLMLVLELLLMAAAGVLLLFVEPLITFSAAAVLVTFGAVYYTVSSPFFQRWGARTLAIEAKMIQAINEALGSIRDVILLNCQPYLEKNFSRHTNDIAKYVTLNTVSQQVPRLAVETLVIVGFVAVVLVLTKTDNSIGDVLATLGIFGMASLRLMPSLNRCLTNASELRYRAALVDVLHKDLTSGLIQDENGHIGGRKEDMPFDTTMRLDKISFQYEGTEQSVLSQIDLAITKGESVGFVGASGAGKTTLMDIVLGLLQPVSGRVIIDGCDSRDNLGAWQDHIGFVSQHIYLTDDLLRRNIAFGIPDQDIDEARLTEVVRLAHLEQVVSNLPDGLNTMVGESGTRLSGGQRQRVAIARALYRDPDVLVFDEATAALDNETEREITDALESLAGEKTLLIIAHRLSTVRNCDKLVFMKDGRIADQGTFDELLSRNAEFRRLAQLGEIEDGDEQQPVEDS